MCYVDNVYSKILGIRKFLISGESVDYIVYSVNERLGPYKG